jgi:transposase
MRGSDLRSGELFSYVDLEDRVPAKHPLRKIRQIVNDVLQGLDGDFAKLYAVDGRPSIPPERLLRASLLQAFYTIRSERQLMEQLDYNLLYRWFVGLGIDDPVWVPTVFSKNRDRLLEADVARQFLKQLLGHQEVSPLLSDEHFCVDGTQLQAWASMKSFVPKEAASGDDAGAPPSAGPGATALRRRTAMRQHPPANALSRRRYRSLPMRPRPPIITAMPRSTSTARSDRTPRISRRPMPGPGSIARAGAGRPGSPISAIR